MYSPATQPTPTQKYKNPNSPTTRCRMKDIRVHGDRKNTGDRYRLSVKIKIVVVSSLIFNTCYNARRHTTYQRIDFPLGYSLPFFNKYSSECSATDLSDPRPAGRDTNLHIVPNNLNWVQVR